MYYQRIIRIPIHIHTSRPQTWLILPSPLFPPGTGIVLRVGIVEIGREAIDRVFKGGDQWRLGVAGDVVSGDREWRVKGHSHGDGPRLVGEIVGGCYRTRLVELCGDKDR